MQCNVIKRLIQVCRDFSVKQIAEVLLEEFTAPILPDLQTDLDFHATA